MANTLIIKNSSTTTAVPLVGDLTEAELALNTTDRKIFTKTAGGFVVEISGVKAITALTDGATITPNFALANNFSVTLGGNRTLANPTNLVVGQSGSIFIVQDGTGSRTLAYGSYWDFTTGAAPVLTTTAAGIDRIDYIVRTTGSIHAVFTGDYS
jgi:hypothetical protein